MKLPILLLASCVASLISFVPAHAQSIYTARPAGGDWSDPNTWTVTGVPNSPAVPTNSFSSNGTETSDNVIIINAAVRLDRDYTVSGDHGKLIIGANGSLTDGTTNHGLTFGQQQGADMTRLELDGTLDVYSISFYKADADVSSSGELRASCNVAVANQSDINIDPGATVDIDGNLVVRQGNPSLTGTGTLMISGCVLTNNNGSLNGLFGPNLAVCVQGEANDCDTEGLQCNTRVADAIGVDACRGPLPVELVSFTGRYQGQQVQLSWATAMEKNAAAFDVERSADGTSFQTLTSVRAAGNSTARREYAVADRNPRQGLNYYRLKQVDADGTYTYSKVLTVQAGKAEQQLEVYSAAGMINLEMRSNGEYRAIRIMDSMGRLLHSETIAAGATGVVTRQISMPRATTGGVYIVQAVTTDGAMSKKFLLQ